MNLRYNPGRALFFLCLFIVIGVITKTRTRALLLMIFVLWTGSGIATLGSMAEQNLYPEADNLSNFQKISLGLKALLFGPFTQSLKFFKIEDVKRKLDR